MAVLSASLQAAHSNYEFHCERGESLREVNDSRSALGLLFDFMRDVMRAGQEFIDSNGGKSTYFVGRLEGDSFLNLTELERIINSDYGLKLSSPFEGCDNISGDVWRGDELLGREERDAVVKLKFDSRAVDLPSHIHSASDRVLIEYEGEGFFHPSLRDFESHENAQMETVPIRQGDVICFPKGLIHTFSTLTSEMGDYSYHLPFIEMDDPLQYTMTREVWYPKKRLA